MTRRAAILGASVTLQHVPGMVRYGSKPSRDPTRVPELLHALRTYENAVAYAPNQVFVGNLPASALRELPRPWWKEPAGGNATGPFGQILPEEDFYELMAQVDAAGLIRLKQDPGAGELPLFANGKVAGAFAAAHNVDESLSAQVLLENLACKAGAVHATHFLLSHSDIDPDSISYVMGSGEEAIGDRYQRGGGGLGKAVAEAAGLRQASGCDIKAFCAGPVHALIVAGALVEAGVYDRVAVVAGGAVAKLGMKFESLLGRHTPILEDLLAGMAIVVGLVDQPGRLVLRMDAVGRHRVAAGSSQQALLEDIVGGPLAMMKRSITDIDVYATELHNPEITEPAGGGDVPDRNYRMLAGLGILRGELKREDLPQFVLRHGLPGFSPTQGHIASAVPWIPHAMRQAEQGRIRSTMLMAKGSLFLGRMTRLWDGASITLEV